MGRVAPRAVLDGKSAARMEWRALPAGNPAMKSCFLSPGVLIHAEGRDSLLRYFSAAGLTHGDGVLSGSTKQQYLDSTHQPL